MTRFRSFWAAALCGLLLLLPFTGRAQRQTSGRPSLDVYGSFSLDGGMKFAGGGFSWCQYDFVGRTAIGLDVFREYHGYTEAAVYDSKGEVLAPEVSYDFVSTDACGSLGYMFRLLAPRSRWVILSAGGHLLAGVKYVPEMAGFQKSSNKNYSSVGFYLGLVPDVQLEVFPLKNVSLYAGFRPRVRILSTVGGYDRNWYCLSVSTGLKFYL